VADAAGKKPVYAFLEDLGASAAYYVASQATKIFANEPAAFVGSIGTMIGLYDYSKAAERDGIEAIVLATGPLKGTGFAGAAITEAQREYLQNLANESQKGFDRAVRDGRGLSQEELESVRTGAVFVAEEALRRKLIDGIQSLDQTIAALVEEIGTRQKGNPDMTKQSEAVTGLAVMETETDGGQDTTADTNTETTVAGDEGKKPETKSADGSSQTAADPRAECGRFLQAFGPAGGQWFAEGKTFDQAQAMHSQALAKENAELKQRLAAVAGAGETQPVSFVVPAGEPNAANQGTKQEARLAQTLGPNLAKVAAGIKFAKP
jgi:signal peptide peptidase SppA